MFPLKKLLQWLRLSVVTRVVVLWSSGPSAQLGLVCMVLHLMFNFKGHPSLSANVDHVSLVCSQLSDIFKIWLSLLSFIFDSYKEILAFMTYYNLPRKIR